MSIRVDGGLSVIGVGPTSAFGALERQIDRSGSCKEEGTGQRVAREHSTLTTFVSRTGPIATSCVPALTRLRSEPTMSRYSMGAG